MSTAEEQSAQARSRGNELYRKGLFDQATKAYFQALKLIPNDSAPLANLSAVRFELGDYSGSTLYGQKALALLKDEPDDSPKKQKLFLRLAKSHLLLLQLGETKDVVKRMVPSQERELIETAVAAHETDVDARSLRRKLFDEIPRFKPYLQDEAESYPIGHDSVEPEFSESMSMASLPAERLSFLFAGIGDGRHFFGNLTQIWVQELRGSTKIRPYHFTLLDLKASSMARNLVMFQLLSELKVTSFDDRGDETMACLIYAYSSQIMPPYAYDVLQKTIRKLISKVDGNKPVADWIYIADSQRGALCRHLRAWQRNLDGKYDTASFRKWGIVQNETERIGRLRTQGKTVDDTVPFCELDHVIYDTMGFMQPDLSLSRKHEPTLKRIATSDDIKSARGFGDYLDANWKPNVTIIDVDWDARREAEALDEVDGSSPPYIFSNPVALGWRLQGNMDRERAKDCGLSSAWDYHRLFWIMSAHALKSLKERLTVEVVVGEMTDCFERIHFDAFTVREEMRGKADPVSFPRTYDRIHMSNIPDYIGGPLTTFLYGRPILNRNKYSALSSCVLLNTFAFNSHSNFLAEYSLLDDEATVGRHFGVSLRKDSPSLNWEGEGLQLSDYTWWTASSEERLAFPQRLSRPAVRRFLHGHLLKICLPVPRPRGEPELVYAPLNVTTLFRLVARLHAIGYPAHWLSEVLAEAFEGKLANATVRAPRQKTMDAKALNQVHPALSTSVKPWSAELTTIGALWRGLLPFGLLLPGTSFLPSLDGVRKYQLTFPAYEDDFLRRPHFMLVFWNAELGGEGDPPRVIRRALLDDEHGDREEKARQVREAGVHVLTTFKWVTATRTASFWLRGDVVETMQQGRWKAYIWRSDTYQRVTKGVLVRDAVEQIAEWTT